MIFRPLVLLSQFYAPLVLAFSVALVAYFVSPLALRYSIEDQYRHLVRSLQESIEHCQYKQARTTSKEVLQIRSLLGAESLKDLPTDERVAYCIMSVGMYAEAKKLLELTPVTGQDRIDGYSIKGTLLPEVLLGLHEDYEAARILRDEIALCPRQVQARGDLAKAYLALGENKLAMESLAQIRNVCHPELFKIFLDMANLDNSKPCSGRRLSDKMIAFWQRDEQLYHCHECIAELDYASHFMKQKGFLKESRDLAAQAEKLKNQ